MNLNPLTIANRGGMFKSAVGLSVLLHTAVILAVLATAASTAPRLLTGEGGGLIHVTLLSESQATEGITAPAPARQEVSKPLRAITMKPVPATQAVHDDSALRQEKRVELASLSVPDFISDASKSGCSGDTGTSSRGTAAADGQGKSGGQGKPGSPGDGKGEAVSIAVPKYRENVQPNYPEFARLRGYQGLVLLSAEVHADGHVGEVRIRKSCGHSLLDRSALDAVRYWKFEPGKRMGVPVNMWVDVPVRFVLND
ncbi:MAG TPA: TonB family protein [Syntrophales bacterium]|nr:TonB family protein [Syntrophales bacterium]